jgi:hypothetical protein
MKELDIEKLNLETINKHCKLFIEQSKSNQFYNKNVFFTQKLKGSQYNQFQVIGNLGGIPSDSEFTSETGFYIISNKIFEDLENGFIDYQIAELEKKINSKGKKYSKLKILTEKVFLEHIHKRCSYLNDKSTLHLIRELI